MPAVCVETRIAAPIELCFDLARDIDFHVKSLASTGELAVAGRTTGLIELGESVTWEGRHIGIRQRFMAKVTEFDRPRYFRDEMTAGAFRSFVHVHRFEQRGHETVMVDDVVFTSPLGPLGRLADRMFLTAYVRSLLVQRGNAIKREAEATASAFS